MEQTKKLAKFCAETTFEDLPKDVVKIAKQTILDTLGSAFGTHDDEPEKPEIINKVVKAFKTPPEAVVIKGGFKAAAPMAAMANGVICHGIDFDDTHGEALTHTSAPIVPAALATAEAEKKSGKDFLLSFVLGFEISVRVGMTVMPSHYKYWHSTATNCTFGAAASAGKNYGFNEEQYINAFGFSGTQAAGLLTYLKFGDYTKSFNPGKTAFNGIFSAIMAKAGGTAPPNMIENPVGYSGAYTPEEPNLEKLTRGLDGGPMVWEILKNMLKPFPSLAASHCPMDVTLKLVIENDIKPEDIKRITNKTYNTVKSHFSNYEPTNVMAARLSVPYTIAVCAAKRDGGLKSFHPETINEPVVQETLKKVEIIADPELNALYPEKFPSQIEIETKDGNVFKGEMYYAKGSPNNPFSDDEVKEKFKSLALPVLDASKVDKIIQIIEDLETLKDVNELSSLMM